MQTQFYVPRVSVAGPMALTRCSRPHAVSLFRKRAVLVRPEASRRNRVLVCALAVQTIRTRGVQRLHDERSSALSSPPIRRIAWRRCDDAFGRLERSADIGRANRDDHSLYPGCGTMLLSAIPHSRGPVRAVRRPRLHVLTSRAVVAGGPMTDAPRVHNAE